MTNQIPSFVVCGANGRVANQLTRILLAHGQPVTAIARDISRLNPLKGALVKLVQASFDDTELLTREFSTATAVFLYSPLILHSRNLNEDQYLIIRSLVKAIRDSGVKNVVLLSSWGAELSERSGGILGCRYFESELRALEGINTLIFRPVWFMENFKYNISLIKMSGINGLAINPLVKFPMVTTKDLADVVAGYLMDMDFKDSNIVYVRSEREYTMVEVTRILGDAVGVDNIRYVEFPQVIQKKGMVDSGELSADAADMLIEINQCISHGRLKVDDKMNVRLTPTTLEVFARTEFASAYAIAKRPRILRRIQGVMLRLILRLAGGTMLKRERILAGAPANTPYDNLETSRQS